MMKGRIRAALLLGAAAGLLAYAATASAQDAPTGAAAQTAPASSATQAATGDGLAEVVVTAERRSENLQKVPLSVAALPGGALRD